MKATPKILASAVALVMALGMSVGTTFAWFSMNTKVTAGNLEIKATASKNLLISLAADDGYGTSVTFEQLPKTVVPASNAAPNNMTQTFYVLDQRGGGYVSIVATAATGVSANGTKYYKASGDNYVLEQTGDGVAEIHTDCYTIKTTTVTGAYNGTDELYLLTGDDYVRQTLTASARLNMDANSAAYAANTTFKADTDCYIKQTVYIKSTGEDADRLKANISILDGTGNKALDPSLRVMLVTNVPAEDAGDPALVQAKVYKPKGTTASGDFSTAAYNAISGLATGNTAQTSSVSPVANDTEIATKIYADKVNQVDIYIWYEGQDPECKATNAVDLDSTRFSFAFYCD